MKKIDQNQSNEPLKRSVRHFVSRVRHLIDLEREYSASYYGTQERRIAARTARNAENDVEEMAKELIQTLDLL